MVKYIYNLFLLCSVSFLGGCAILNLPGKALDTVGKVATATGKIADAVGKTAEAAGKVAITAGENPAAQEAIKNVAK